MARAFLGLGSNSGDRLKFLREAVTELSAVSDISVVSISGVYETEPFGVREQRDFLNAVAVIECDLGPAKFAGTLGQIERRVGRKAAERWGPREIDIDLLYFGGEVLKTPTLTLPHPGVAKRRFVLVPLAELAPDFRDPETGITVSEMLARCPDSGRVKKTSMNLR